MLHNQNQMLKPFIECIALISSMIVVIENVYYYLNRYDRRKKVFERPVDYNPILFDTVDYFDIKQFVESPNSTFDESELGYNN